jgi:hypothetical protein
MAAERLTVGDAFPAVTLQSVDGPVDVSERWRDGPLILAFERHFG